MASDLDVFNGTDQAKMPSDMDVFNAPVSERHDLLGPALKKIMSRPANSAPDLGPALQTIGGVFQRGEAAVANPLLSLQAGKPGDIPAAIGRGLSGQQQGEIGDIYRNSQIPGLNNEYVAAGIGLVENPMNFISAPVGMARRAAMRIVGNTADKGGQLAAKGAMSFLQDQPPAVTKAAMDNKFRFAEDGRNFKPEAPAALAKEMSDLAELTVHKPAQEAWNNLKINNASAVVPKVQEPINAIQDIMNTGFLSPNENKTLQGLQKVLDPHNTAGDAVRRNFIALGGQTAPLGASLGDVYGHLKGLDSAADKSVAVRKAVQIVRDHLADNFDELKPANSKWTKWSSVNAKLEQAFGPLEDYNLARGTERIRTNPGNVVHIINDPIGSLTKNFGQLAKELGYPEYSEHARDIALGQAFSRYAPGWKGIFASEMLHGAGEAVMGSAGAAADAHSGFISGIGTSILGGSKRIFAGTQAKLRAMGRFMDSPAGQFAGRRIENAGRMADTGALRQMTGLNDQEDQQ